MLSKSICLLFIIAINLTAASAQEGDLTPLFKDERPLEIKLQFSFREIKKSTADSIYFPTFLSFRNEQGGWDSIPIALRARGNFRRANCNFPPLRLKLKKKDTEGTMFQGNKNLKLVLPCQSESNTDLIMKEYVCYQLYELVTPYIFNTRLVNITLTDQSGKKGKAYTLRGFFIEDNDLVAKRFNGKIVQPTKSFLPGRLHDTTAVRHDFFQYLIGNTDWSSRASHNVSLLQMDVSKFVPLAYDFDMAGLVNAPYATVNDKLGISDVSQRLYRGLCREEKVFEYVRSQYLRLEPAIYGTLESHALYFADRELNSMKKYLSGFFAILKNDKQFRSKILLDCRRDQ